MATKDPQKIGPAKLAGRVMAANRPVALTAPTELDNLLLLLANSCFHNLIKSAPITVNPATLGNCSAKVLKSKGPPPINAAGATGAKNKLAIKNWVVQAHCAINPSRPPTPTSHFLSSKIVIIAAQVTPRTAPPTIPGITASRAMPAKDPQKAAKASGSGSTMVEIRPAILEALTGPKLATLFNKKVPKVATAILATLGNETSIAGFCVAGSSYNLNSSSASSMVDGASSSAVTVESAVENCCVGRSRDFRSLTVANTLNSRAALVAGENAAAEEMDKRAASRMVNRGIVVIVLG